MGFLGTESGVVLSRTGIAIFDEGCGGLMAEGSDAHLIMTDDVDEPQIIFFEECQASRVEFPCDEPREYYKSGKFVEITNTCNLPITLTGFKNSDASRFSLFQYPDYLGYEFYWSGNTAELPIKIDPFEKTKFEVFFHPLNDELSYGNHGTYENRSGDFFEAKISLYPGLPLRNCGTTDDCDAFFRLSGEFLCTKDDKQFMHYSGGYIDSEIEIPGEHAGDHDNDGILDERDADYPVNAGLDEDGDGIV